MDAELDLLHGKILQLAELCRQLRLDNNQLRDRLAEREVENRDLKYKVEETRELRVWVLVKSDQVRVAMASNRKTSDLDRDFERHSNALQQLARGE